MWDLVGGELPGVKALSGTQLAIGMFGLSLYVSLYLSLSLHHIIPPYVSLFLSCPPPSYTMLEVLNKCKMLLLQLLWCVWEGTLIFIVGKNTDADVE